MVEPRRNWVLDLPSDEFWIWSLIALAVALGAFYGVFRFVHRVRIIEDTPTSRVRSAAQGFVELVGQALLLPGPPILAPLTGAACAWWEFKVEKKVTRIDAKGNSRTSWETIRSGTSTELFLLRDETGECVIDPEGATVIPSSNDVWYGSSPHWQGPPAKQGFVNLGEYRFTEQRIELEDPLYAIGLFRTVSAASEAPDLREEVRALLNSWKRDPATMARFDANGDGQVDLKEWEQARREAQAVVERERMDRMAAPPTNLLSRPTEGRRPFILSTLPEQALTRRFRWFALGSLLLFAAAGGLAGYMFVTRFAW